MMIEMAGSHFYFLVANVNLLDALGLIRPGPTN